MRDVIGRLSSHNTSGTGFSLPSAAGKTGHTIMLYFIYLKTKITKQNKKIALRDYLMVNSS